MQQRIYLIDDDEAIRCSLSALLATVGWQTETFASVQQFQAAVTDLPALSGCLLLDIRMPGKTGMTLLEEWRGQGLTIPVIIMTGHGNIDLCRRAFKNGAFEFLTKPIDADTLFDTVGAAMEQRRQSLQQQQKTAELQTRLATLSAREQEVIALIVEGKANKEIARELELSPRTVEAHRANAFARLGVNSLAKLIRLYGGLTPPEEGGTR
ncbi:response regulator transcription factor [Enterobacteriaceae bacterium BIT-l23]|uniref:Response regulator transcription factor n=1 Tax=Jejubacter calystegiae TaxID=2579935 RepID=A0A4P8YG78_9ENTR|nr:response regulator [Jejubacter calystegiae]NUU68057.1 response regulator transcription factor [Enterobacteriaceae bacterium BIT-l23]QCT19629.1 response regulator transcription factor [Jejubacter calystegiae]